MIRRLTPRWRLRATAAALVLPPLIHVVKLDRIIDWIGRSWAPPGPDPTVDDPALADWIDRFLNRLPPPWKRTCLRRALVLHYLLHRAGRPAELRIGVRRDEHDELAAHAWLMRNGEPYLENGAERIETFQVLTTLSSHGGQRP